MRSFCVISFLIFLSTGCAGERLFPQVEERLTYGDCTAATQMIDGGAAAYGGDDRLLYLLDAAMVHMQCDGHAAAQQYFRQADALAEALYTESITKSALSFVVNDTVQAYTGEDFERVMLHLMSAIGFLQSDQYDEALVEVRRLDSLLSLFNDRYEKKNVYKSDAFARYLSALLHEADGAWDDAFIDYRRAAQVYQSDYRAYATPMPAMLADDLIRAAHRVHRTEEIEKLVPAERIAGWTTGPPKSGTVVLITFAGFAPQKVQDMVVVPTPHGPVGIAFPRMVITPPDCRPGRLTLRHENTRYDGELALVEDINRIAVKNLEDRKGRIIAKTIARAVAKQAVIASVAHASEDRENQRTIEAILNIINTLWVERADTRSWRTLPGQIYMARLDLPAGDYGGVLESCGGVKTNLGPVSVSAGTTRYLFRDLRYPPAYHAEGRE